MSTPRPLTPRNIFLSHSFRDSFRNTLSLLSLCFILCITFTACFSGEKESDTHHGEAIEAEEGREAIAINADSTDTLPAMKRLPYEEIEIKVSDGVRLQGRLYDPSQKPENDSEEEEIRPTHKYPLVVLLHGLNGTHTDWNPLPNTLVKKGYAVFAFDTRGHGKTAKYHRSWRSFLPGDWARFPNDTERALHFFDKPADESDYPQIDAHQIALIGAGIGANSAIITASRNSSTVKALALLSASLSYKGLETTKPLHRYTNAVLMIASRNDVTAFESSEILYKLPKGPKSILLYKNVGHGSEMLHRLPKISTELLQWLTKSLPPQALPIQYPPEEDDNDDE